MAWSKFLEGAEAAGQRDEAVGQFRHQRLALAQAFDHAQVGQFFVDDLLEDHRLRNHADDVAAVFQSRAGPDAR